MAVREADADADDDCDEVAVGDGVRDALTVCDGVEERVRVAVRELDRVDVIEAVSEGAGVARSKDRRKINTETVVRRVDGMTVN